MDKKTHRIIAHRAVSAVISTAIIYAIDKAISKNKKDDKKERKVISKKQNKKEDTYKQILHAIQNVDDDTMTMPLTRLPENFGNKEYSLIKLYKEGRLLAKNSERDVIVKNYGNVIELVDIDEKNKYTNKKAIEKYYTVKPKVIMRDLTYCPSCQKMFDDIKGFDFDSADFEFIIMIGKDDAKENTIDAVPERLRDKVIITNKKDTLNLGLNRFPTTMFLDEKNRLFDIGGLVSMSAIEQRLLDIPEFPSNYDVKDEL